MKKKVGGCAVIAININGITMGIFQNTRNGVSCIDKLEYPLALGHEVFTLGNIGFNSLNELSSILNKYKLVCEGYGITDIVVYSTTVLREALNCEVVKDRIKINTSLDINVLDDSSEKSMIYYDIINNFNKISKKHKNVVIAYIGSGSIGIATYNGECITKNYNIQLGAVRFHELLSGLRGDAVDYHNVVEEYLKTVYKKLDIKNCDCIILTGAESSRIADLTNSKFESGLYQTERKEMSGLYKDIKVLTGENIAVKYEITEDTATMLSTTLNIAHELYRSVGENPKIYISKLDLEKTIASINISSVFKQAYQKHIYDSSIAVSLAQSKKFCCDEQHFSTVRSKAMKLYDKLKPVHGLDDKFRRLLEISCILHSTGQYINIRSKVSCTFGIIKNLDIYGLSQEEVQFVSFICTYSDNLLNDVSDYKNFISNSPDNQLNLVKLIAIFRLADALDRSQKNKITINTMKIEDEFFIIKASTNETAYLEEWAFNQCSEYFSKIFGLKPQLTVKLKII